MSIIKNREIVQIIRKTLNIANPTIANHSEMVSYLYFKMMQALPEEYPKEELPEYALIGLLHDIGMLVEPNLSEFDSFDTTDPAKHSLYGSMFVKYMFPFPNKAEQVLLNHHLPYNKLYKENIDDQVRKSIYFLAVAEKMDLLRRGKIPNYYFKLFRDVTVSGDAVDHFMKLQAKEKVLDKLANDSYKKEMDVLWDEAHFSDEVIDKLLEMVALFFDMKSPYLLCRTTARVFYADALAERLKLGAWDKQQLHVAAYLADLGLIAVPMDILESTEKLSPESLQIKNTHAILTETILTGCIEDPIVQLAIRHHEFLDGSGYPRGLKKKELTIPQQVLAVADLTAQTLERKNYMAVHEHEYVQDVLDRYSYSGKINDQVVECLLRHYDDMYAEYQKKRVELIGKYQKIQTGYRTFLPRMTELLTQPEV